MPDITGEELLDKLLDSFSSDYDIERPYSAGDLTYDAYAAFRAVSAKYVLVKSAELWRAKNFEHIFFRLKPRPLDAKDVADFRRQIDEYIEPQLVRKGERFPEQDHMYTYITVIYICFGVSEQAKKAVKSFRYEKNYLLSLRGYSQGRILVFDLCSKEISGSPGAKKAVKAYRKAGIF